ncbi:hypothetical protein QTI66_38895 [Variovorax sp. J22R133]|uniref:hypothetical protein n=1 Tax=Variovorax brevis TaxID=3053503 RepID=UPI0025752D07|nr:hypothetical protein [Variovorax sp. J22R133]MDM0118047.1 hypothetical protein [Variovorax sp. J22R133]
MPTIKLSAENYARWKTFFVCYAEWFIPEIQKSKNPEDPPLSFLEGIEKTLHSKEGLQVAIHRIVEMTSDWTTDQVDEADAWFAAAGAFTLSEIRRRYSKKYFRVLKRGAIRSQTEYDLVKGIVEAGGIEPGAKEEAKLRGMLAAFEARLVASLEEK